MLVPYRSSDFVWSSIADQQDRVIHTAGRTTYVPRPHIREATAKERLTNQKPKPAQVTRFLADAPVQQRIAINFEDRARNVPERQTSTAREVHALIHDLPPKLPPKGGGFK